MCSNHRLTCSCGRNQANLMFKNHILPPAVVANLHCPKCSEEVAINEERMIVDNHWILEFDLRLASGYLERAQIHSGPPSSSFLFDQGYATWNGLTPNELDQRLEERREIIALATQNMRLYLKEMRRWGCERVEKLREAGWRKAQQC